MYLRCEGPGPHTPASGIIGEAANDVSKPWCGECVRRLIATPPENSPIATKLEEVVAALAQLNDRTSSLTDAVEQLILNDLNDMMMGLDL